MDVLGIRMRLMYWELDGCTGNETEVLGMRLMYWK